MKKLIVSACLLMSALVLSAQEETINQRPDNASVTNKFGHQVLPVAGDYALGIDAAPFFKYLGNMFNGNTGNNSPTFDGFGTQIYGKYFLTDQTAVRARLSFDFGSDRLSHTVTQDPIDPLNPNKTTVDYFTTDNSKVNLSLGYEFRRGYRRLQGFYGAEVGLGFSSMTKKYSYGNVMTAANQTPTSWDFENGTESNLAARMLKSSNGMLINAGLNGFVGVEYFVAPKLSIGGELQLGVYGQMSTLGSSKYEQYNAHTGNVENYTHRINKGAANNIHFKTLATGSLFVMFHF